jgi:hypothetical protein
MRFEHLRGGARPVSDRHEPAVQGGGRRRPQSRTSVALPLRAVRTSRRTCSLLTRLLGRLQPQAVLVARQTLWSRHWVWRLAQDVATSAADWLRTGRSVCLAKHPVVHLGAVHPPVLRCLGDGQPRGKCQGILHARTAYVVTRQPTATSGRSSTIRCAVL